MQSVRGASFLVQRYLEEVSLQPALEEFKCRLRPNDGGRSFQTAGEALVKPRLTIYDLWSGW